MTAMNYFLNIQQYTWRRKDRSQASRIDIILIGTYFINLVAFCKIKPTVIESTDHQSVCLKFNPGLTEIIIRCSCDK